MTDQPSQTPRTDVVLAGQMRDVDSNNLQALRDMTACARQLERELSAARRDAERWQWAMKHPAQLENIIQNTGNEPAGHWATMITNKVDAILAAKESQ